LVGLTGGQSRNPEDADAAKGDGKGHPGTAGTEG